MIKSRLVVCRVCHELFDQDDASSTHRMHPGSWAGFEKGKLHGTSTTDASLKHVPQIVFQWDCCGSQDAESRGCQTKAHEAYN